MEYKFCFTDESKNIDDIFVATLGVIPEEKAILDGPADNWYPGAPAQIEIEDIYFADKPASRISKELYILLAKKIDDCYDDILFQHKELKKENKLERILNEKSIKEIV